MAKTYPLRITGMGIHVSEKKFEKLNQIPDHVSATYLNVFVSNMYLIPILCTIKSICAS